MSAGFTALQIAVIAAVTALLRFLPFLAFPPGRKTPPVIAYLSRALPPAVIGMLVIYCLKDTTPFVSPYALPEIISVALVLVTYLWKKSPLISIAGGTLCYMLLVQVVFV